MNIFIKYGHYTFLRYSERGERKEEKKTNESRCLGVQVTEKRIVLCDRKNFFFEENNIDYSRRVQYL
jgi:hypothetical protein